MSEVNKHRMSASQIPNLLASRGGPRSRGGRGRGRGTSTNPTDHGAPSTGVQQRRDLAIVSTDTDAAVSRLSAVDLGYMNDPFAPYFVNGTGIRRLPIINRGTYTRTTALDILINAFLEKIDPEVPRQTKQIISLGAGTDTRYFRLRSQNKHQNLIYHEFDFPSVCETKRQTVGSNQLFASGEGEALFPPRGVPTLSGQEPEWGFERTTDGTSETVYCCHPLDLRQLPYGNLPREFQGLRRDVPTLIISECCLCYLDVDTSRDVVKWFIERMPSLGIVLYEPIGINDPFGEMMVANLAARDIRMPSLSSFRTLQDQKSRLSDLGFEGLLAEAGQEAETIEDIWASWVSSAEKQRVDDLEGLDEVEEWQMLARHYAVVWGWKGVAGWAGWAGLRNKN